MGSMLTVSQLCKMLSFKLSQDMKLKGIAVQGEISNLSAGYGSGHLFFTIRDENCAIRCIMYSSNAQRLKAPVDNGMSVVALGSISFYEAGGNVQLVCTDMVPAGAGKQNKSLDELKKRLAAMGVFDVRGKKKLPKSPRRIAVVTSPNGAALQDILNVIGRRCPSASVVVSPALVQGEKAEQSVVDALRLADNAGCDVIILARGGGSSEDLMAFNSEKVVMAVYNCKTPIISALGHETDTTLADYAADMRAPTPSAAAEIAVPTSDNIFERVGSLEKRIQSAVNRRLDNSSFRLQMLSQRIIASSPKAKLTQSSKAVEELRKRLDRAVKSRADRAESSLCAVYSRIDALNPLAVLGRGYAIVTDESGHTVTQTTAEGSIIDVKMQGFGIKAKVLQINADK